MATHSDVGTVDSPLGMRVAAAIRLYKMGDDSSYDLIESMILPSILAYSYRNNFYVEGYENEDIKQIARIALLTAIRGWDESKKIALLTFAIAIFRNTIYDLLSSSSRRINLESSDDIDTEIHHDYSLATLLDDELVTEIRNTLTELEFIAWQQVILLDIPYKEVAERYGVTEKAIDNAIQRAKVKLGKNQVILNWVGSHPSENIF